MLLGRCVEQPSSGSEALLGTTEKLPARGVALPEQRRDLGVLDLEDIVQQQDGALGRREPLQHDEKRHRDSIERLAATETLVPRDGFRQLVAATALFTLIAWRYLLDPVASAAPARITFGSNEAITNTRVGFGAFPLGFALVTLGCLVSERRLLMGLGFLVTLVAVVTLVRMYGLVVDGPAPHTSRVLVNELVLLVLSSVALLLEN